MINSLGNARLVRNLFEKSLKCLSVRVSGDENPTVEQLTTISAGDILEVVAWEKENSSF